VTCNSQKTVEKCGKWRETPVSIRSGEEYLRHLSALLGGGEDEIVQREKLIARVKDLAVKVRRHTACAYWR
jgi:hypothetical protein